jgi:hypothetical protein
MHSDKLLEVVLDQIQQDIKDGDVTSLFDMLEYIDHDTLVGFLSYRDLPPDTQVMVWQDGERSSIDSVDWWTDDCVDFNVKGERQ